MTPKQQTDDFIATASRAELQRVLRVLVDRSIEAAVLAYQQIPAPGTYELAEPDPAADDVMRECPEFAEQAGRVAYREEPDD